MHRKYKIHTEEYKIHTASEYRSQNKESNKKHTNTDYKIMHRKDKIHTEEYKKKHSFWI